MASLTGASIASSYTSLLKLSGNTNTLADGTGSNAIQVVDGDGTASNLYLNTDRIGIGGQPSQDAKLMITGGAYNTSLVIKGSGTNSGIVFYDSDGTHDGTILAMNSAIGFLDAGGDEMIMADDASGSEQIRFGITGTTRMKIDSSGNIGIGTVSPSAKIHSTGTILIDQSAGTSNSAVLRLEADRGSADQDSGEIRFYNQGGSDHDYARIIGTRGGADNSGYLSFKTSEAGTEGTALKITSTQDSDFQSNYIVNEQGRQNHVANTMSSPYYQFDGVDDKIASAETFQTTFRNSFSISALVRFEDGQPSAKQTIFGLYDGTSGIEAVQLLLLTDGTLRFIFTIDSNSATFTSSAVFGDGDTGWNHIVAVADESSDTIGVYLNGNSLGTTSTSSHVWTDYTSSQPPWIGARNLNGGWNEGMQGSIQNLKVWNRYLSATEVKDDYSGASVPFKYKGANQTNISSFDFTSGWSASSGASVVDSNSFSVSASNGQGIYKALLTVGKSYRLVLAGTMPGGMSMSVRNSAGGANEIGSGFGTYEFTATDTSIYLRVSGATGQIDVSAFTIVPIGAVAEFDGSGAGEKVWGDKSGNDLHGTVDGATLENTPYDSGTEYEEGTATIVIKQTNGSNPMTMSSSSATYTKIGRKVTVNGYIATSSIGSCSGAIMLTGLPYSLINNNNAYTSVNVGYAGGLALGSGTEGQSIGGYGLINSSNAYLHVWDGTDGTSALTADKWSDDGNIMFSITYFTA